MSEKIELTWPDGDGRPMRIINPELVSYPRETTVTRGGKKVIERTITEFTVASVRPATAAEVKRWRGQ